MNIFGHNVSKLFYFAKAVKDTCFESTFAGPGVLPGHKSENKEENMIPSDNLRLDKVYEGFKVSDYAAVADQEKVAANLGNKSIHLFKN